jgi:hypothetical protein
MWFGDKLTSLYQAASGASKAVFNEVAKTTEEAANALEHGYQYTKEKAGQAFEYGQEKVHQAYDYSERKAHQAYDYSKEKAHQAKDYAVKEYDAAQKSIKNQIQAARQAVDKKLYPKPAGETIKACPLKDKRSRVNLRRQKISDSKEKLKTMPAGQKQKALAQATERLERTNHDIERLFIANDTYTVNKIGADGKRPPPPAGWDRVGKDEMEKLGIDTELFPQSDPRFNPEQYGDGFYAELYKSQKDVFGEETYVLGLRGTQGKQDWLEGNAKQAVGMQSKHYEQAKNIARKLNEALGQNKKLEFAGDSLAGAMATTAGIITGRPAVTSDTAGVHPNTLGTFTREEANKLVNNYYTKGEILTTVQNPAVQRSVMAAGVGIGGAPAAAGMFVAGGRALKEQGTLTYGAAGPMYEVPALANADAVVAATAKGQSIQGLSPGLGGRLNNDYNPVKKIAMHINMNYVIAGVEQQKADDLAVIDRNLTQ